MPVHPWHGFSLLAIVNNTTNWASNNSNPCSVLWGHIEAELLDHVIANFTFSSVGFRMKGTKTSNIVGKYSTFNQWLQSLIGRFSAGALSLRSAPSSHWGGGSRQEFYPSHTLATHWGTLGSSTADPCPQHPQCLFDFPRWLFYFAFPHVTQVPISLHLLLHLWGFILFYLPCHCFGKSSQWMSHTFLFNVFIAIFIYFYFYVYVCFACMYVYALGMYLVPEEVRRRYRIL